MWINVYMPCLTTSETAASLSWSQRYISVSQHLQSHLLAVADESCMTSKHFSPAALSLLDDEDVRIQRKLLRISAV